MFLKSISQKKLNLNNLRHTIYVFLNTYTDKINFFSLLTNLKNTSTPTPKKEKVWVGERIFEARRRESNHYIFLRTSRPNTYLAQDTKQNQKKQTWPTY